MFHLLTLRNFWEYDEDWERFFWENHTIISNNGGTITMYEGSTMPTDPHHTPTILQSSSYQPQKNHKPRKPTRKVTEVPQPSDPIKHVADVAVHKELRDSLVRVATSASSLEVEQDSGNINRTRSKATPNESSSQETSSGGDPKCQEAMGILLFKLGNEIASLKRRVKKLVKKNRSRTHKLKRLYKVGLTARVESSEDKESLGEDASKQGRRIDDIDADEDITLSTMLGGLTAKGIALIATSSSSEQFWSTTVAKTINEEAQIHARVDGKKDWERFFWENHTIISNNGGTITMCEGSTMPTDPHHTHTILQSSSYQPQKTHKPRKPTRKVTEVPQPSDPIKHVTDVAVHKELGDSLVRVATSASSLEVEQDIGNINRTRSKETPNESSSQETSSGGDPRCQEAMGILLFKLARVLDLEKIKTSQGNEIASLKRRVKKLVKKNRSRTHKLKRLYKVGLNARVESSRDKESLGEDASKQGRRIDDIDADEYITLVNV
uniref:Uncharacterized protein n=1 Tax=Tanacetum cinerariifolium TaxID=118510 RepID=A0A699HVM2_TANCI|nr:hypothetical protein [Tanacetum cinerariifolium]